MESSQHQTPPFYSRHQCLTNRNAPPKTFLGAAESSSNRCRTLRSALYNWGMATTAACERGAENQTAELIVTNCPSYSPPHGTDGLVQLDEETISWLQKSCPDI